MATVAPRLITAEEFFGMPEPADGSRRELIRGAVVTTPTPIFRHGECLAAVASLLGQWVRSRPQGRVAIGTSVLMEQGPDSVRRLDVGYWSWGRLADCPGGPSAPPPDLAVLLISPSDRYSPVVSKIRQCLGRGVRRVWAVDLEARSATAFRSDSRGYSGKETAVLSDEDVLPGFSCPVADLFA